MTHHPGAFRPITNLQDGLLSTAHWIWDRRSTAKRQGFPFSEETVTETVLLDLASALSSVIHIVPFSKPQEGRTGADWEWCLYDRRKSRYLRFLIQAKVLDDRDHQYAHVDRFIGNTAVRQIDRLADTCQRRRVPGLYAFYNHLNDASRLPTGRCPCFHCDECWGASIAPLSAVYAAVSLHDRTFDTLRHVSMPWHCMLCAGSGQGASGDPIASARAGLARLQRLGADRYPDAGDLSLPPLDQPPWPSGSE